MLEEYLSEKQRKKEKHRRRLWWLAAMVLVFGVTLFIFWVVAESPVFRIDHVVVTGNLAVRADDVANLLQASMSRHATIWSTILGTKNMLIWPRALASSDIALVPQLAGVALQKNYADHTITASVIEREPVAIWCEMPAIDANGNPSGDESCFWFDDTGTLFEKAFDTEGSELFAVHDYSQKGLGIGKNILPGIFVPNMLSILGTVKASSITVKEIALNDISLQEVDVSTYNGPAFYFSLRFSADDDLEVLRQLMEKPDFNSLQYVDFRTENRVYYK
jgi:lambda repressor-like predicted transcriptional regulator